MSSNRKYHIAADIGAGSGRVFAGWMENGKLVIDELRRFETGDMVVGNKHVRNVYRWQEELVAGLKDFVKKYGDRFESVGVDSFGQDFVLLNKQGGILKMPMAYRYAKPSAAAIKELNDYGSEKLYASCGNHSTKNDTVLQLIEAKIEENSVFSEARYLVFFGDLFQYFLCGKAYTELSMAGYSKMFNQEKQDWDDDIFHTFGLPECLKMPVVKYGDQLGEIVPEICEEIGVSNRPMVVTPCIHDTSDAAFAVPDDRSDTYFVSSGSWSLVGVPTDKAICTAEAWRFNASNSAMPIDHNMFKKNVTGMWLMQCCQSVWEKFSFAEITRFAETAPSRNLFIDPDAERFFNPRNMPQEISTDVAERYGVTVAPEDVGAIARIVFESIAMKYRFTLDHLGALCGITPGRLFIVGGGSQNNLLNQFSANACGLTVYAGIPEASVVGSVLCQMYGMGEISTEAEAKKIVRDTFPVKIYQPQEAVEWDRRYVLFLEKTGLN